MIPKLDLSVIRGVTPTNKHCKFDDCNNHAIDGPVLQETQNMQKNLKSKLDEGKKVSISGC